MSSVTIELRRSYGRAAIVLRLIIAKIYNVMTRHFDAVVNK